MLLTCAMWIVVVQQFQHRGEGLNPRHRARGQPNLDVIDPLGREPPERRQLFGPAAHRLAERHRLEHTPQLHEGVSVARNAGQRWPPTYNAVSDCTDRERSP
jgi:hypothetical protein